jgi:hypothetical protein
MHRQDKAKEPRRARGKANPLERIHSWDVPLSPRRMAVPDFDTVKTPCTGAIDFALLSSLEPGLAKLLDEARFVGHSCMWIGPNDKPSMNQKISSRADWGLRHRGHDILGTEATYRIVIQKIHSKAYSDIKRTGVRR